MIKHYSIFRNTTNRSKIVIIVMVLLLVSYRTANAQNEASNAKGEEIALQAYQAASGFGSYSVDVDMTNIDRKNSTNNRAMTITILETDDGHRSRFKVQEPYHLQGTSVLSYSYAKDSKDNDQWVYLPQQRKIRRLVARRRTGSFLGSQLTYEDLIPQEVTKFTHVFLRNEACPITEQHCHVLRRIPKQKDNHYASQLVWIRIDNLITERVLYLDENQTEIKQLDNKQFKKFKGKFWQPQFTKVVNLTSKAATELQRSQFYYGGNDKDDIRFTPSGFYR